jgi:hypothetical protein
MKPLKTIYWLRLCLGLVAAVICGVYAWVTRNTSVTSGGQDLLGGVFMNSISIALAIYLISFYAIKAKFAAVVEKPQKLVSTGIGVYFMAWIVFWVLFYTIMVWQKFFAGS